MNLLAPQTIDGRLQDLMNRDRFKSKADVVMSDSKGAGDGKAA
jgi:hypothetical protein